LGLDEVDRKTIGIDIKTVEYGWPIGMPVSRPLGKGLYEVRSNISNKRITRVIFTIVEHYIILLNGFVKKTQKTPKEEIDLALLLPQRIVLIFDIVILSIVKADF
jgi:phage-related protein